MKKTRILALALVVILTLSLMAGCASKTTATASPSASASASASVAASSSEPIKVGVLAPLTGNVAVYGIAVKNAVEMYVNEFNAAGGVNGRQIKLVVLDEKGDATEAVNAYNKLVTSDEVVAIIGDVTSTPTFAVAQASVADNMPLLTPTATHPDVTTYGHNTFRACFQDPFQGSTMAKLAFEKLGAKTAAIIFNSSDAYSTGLKDSFTEAAGKAGLQIVATEAYGASDVDFKSQLTNINSKSPDVLFIPDYYNQCYMIASQAREIGLKSTFLGVDGTDGVLAIEGVNAKVLDGLYFANHYSADDTSSMVQTFRTNYQKAYKDVPNALAALGYDGAMIMCAAIKAVATSGKAIDNSDVCRQAIIDAISATDMDCVTGHITYDKTNNPIKECSIIKIVLKDDKGAYEFFGKY